MSLRCLLAALALTTLPALSVAQDQSTILVLDGSGSMWAELPEGRSRIEVARDVLVDFLAARDPAQDLGVIAYGHNRKGDCSDIETIAPVGAQDPRILGPKLMGLMPRGKTPLADALRRAAAEIPSTSEGAEIVLVTDGLETCGGDPCAVAAELAASGVPLRAHVVGFGLTEGEVRQIACVAEETGGTVFSTQSGAELADALLRTAAAPSAPAAAGAAAVHVTIRADIAGRPDQVRFTAVSEATGETLDLGLVDFDTAQYLEVELDEGRWMITADAGEEGRGEIVAGIVSGENATIYVPFQGLLPGLDMPAPTGAFRAGMNGLIPYRITQEGLATGGGDFIFSLLPVDATDTGDRLIDYATQDSTLGGHVGLFRVPTEPGRYLIAFHRNTLMPIDEVMQSFEISVEARPEVGLVAPEAVATGARVPVAIKGGLSNNDRIEIWRDGGLYSWDQSLYVQDTFDTEYGPAKPLLAPMEAGEYELVYIFTDLDGEEAIAARQPLTVGEVIDFDEASLAPENTGVEMAINTQEIAPSDEPALGEDVGYACPADNGVPCIFDDEATGLLFALPPGWFTDFPTRTSATAGNQSTDGPVRISFFSSAEPYPDTIVLNPHQWTEMNGPCLEVQAGQLCFFAPGTKELQRGIVVLTRALHDRRPAPKAAVPFPEDALKQAMTELSKTDPAAAAAMEGLLGAANGTGNMPELGAMLGAALGQAFQQPDADGHGPDAGGMGERAWSDYPHRCLPEDKTTEFCDMRDAETSLFFHLPETWVAEVLSGGSRPVADFFEVASGANRIALNPAKWPEAERACALTRVGDLCRDPDINDPALARAFDTLRATLTTGEVLRRCGNEPCTFAHPNPPLSGTLPPLWSVEVGRTLPDGRVATWFWDMDRSGNFKLLGLNQSGGEDCFELQPGDRICSFTPYITDEEISLIATMLVPPSPEMRDALAQETDVTLDDQSLQALAALLNAR